MKRAESGPETWNKERFINQLREQIQTKYFEEVAAVKKILEAWPFKTKLEVKVREASENIIFVSYGVEKLDKTIRSRTFESSEPYPQNLSRPASGTCNAIFFASIKPRVIFDGNILTKTPSDRKNKNPKGSGVPPVRRTLEDNASLAKVQEAGARLTEIILNALMDMGFENYRTRYDYLYEQYCLNENPDDDQANLLDPADPALQKLLEEVNQNDPGRFGM